MLLGDIIPKFDGLFVNSSRALTFPHIRSAKSLPGATVRHLSRRMGTRKSSKSSKEGINNSQCSLTNPKKAKSSNHTFFLGICLATPTLRISFVVHFGRQIGSVGLV